MDSTTTKTFTRAPDPECETAVCFDYALSPTAAVDGASQVVRYVNAAFCRMLDKSADRLIGGKLFDLLPGKDHCALLFEHVHCSGIPESHTLRQPSGLDGAFWSYTMWPALRNNREAEVIIQVVETERTHKQVLEMNAALMIGSVRQHALTEAADSANVRLNEEIRERKLTEIALHRLQATLSDHAAELEELVTERTAQLTKTNQQLEAFAYSIAHDLRAPLRAMQGFSELLIQNAGTTLNEDSTRYADRINKAAQFMDAMLCDLLAFSRISQGVFALSETDSGRVVESVLALLQREIADQGAEVASEGPWPAVLAHEPTLFGVLFNLVSNALKFSLPDIPSRVRLHAEERGQFIRIWVEDNGVGIASDYQAQIFELFTRLNGERYPGTGIGLAIVKKGIERMSGQLGVESDPGHGSRFWFELRKA